MRIQARERNGSGGEGYDSEVRVCKGAGMGTRKGKV